MVMIMPPFFGATLRVSEPGIYEFFRRVSDEIRIPIMIQDAPMAGTSLSAPFLARMAKEMQANMAKAQAELAEATVEGTAGGGAVVIVLTGTQDMKDIRISKDAVDPDDVETLQDLIRAAFSDALTKSRELAANRLGSVTGGLKIPGM